VSDLNILTLTSLAAGLSAASGFRVLLPPLALGVSAHYGVMPLGVEYEWLARPETIAILALAAFIEIVVFYIPFLDHLLDIIAIPAAILAGGFMSYALLDGTAPIVKWSLVVIAGAGPAILTQSSSSLLRAASTATTGGLGNFVIATIELFGASFVIALAIFAPLICLGLVASLCVAIAIGAKKGFAYWQQKRGSVNYVAVSPP